MKKNLLALLWMIAVFTPVLAPAGRAADVAADFQPALDKMELKSGDTLVFLGDSITHQCLYTQYLEDYFYTRYPDRRIHFHNAGVGGDKASDALLRFDEDVAQFKPKYVTLLLGMNDGRYTKFDPEIFATYEKDMGVLLDRIAALGATAIPMTPTMFDARAARMGKKGSSEPRDTYYNSVLAYFGTYLREQASVRGLGFVDMYSALNNLTVLQRKKDAKFTMIPDAVHPGPAGQVVMAAAIIADMVPHTSVSVINIQDATGAKPRATGSNGKLTDFQGGDKISFTFKANALPWVLPPDAAEGYKLTKAGHRHGQDKLTVGNLKPGNYELRIDGQLAGTYTDARLAAGVELEENDKTPQYQQALKVALLNKERNEKGVHALRDHWRTLKGKRLDLQKTEPDAQKAAEKKAAFDKWLPGFKENVAKAHALANEYENQIYQANQPVAHKYELIRAN